MQCRSLLLAAVIPTALVTGCTTASDGTQAMLPVVSPAPEPSDSLMSPEPSDSAPMSPEPSDSATAAPVLNSPRAAVEAFFAAVKAGDAEKAAAVFTSDGMAAVAGEPTATGTEALRKLFGSAPDVSNSSHTIDETQNIGTDAAFVRATTRSGDKTYREFFLLQKSDSDWKIDRYMSNKAS
jgi:ketosteroid isomerase-like protein